MAPLAEREWLVSLSGELGTKASGTREELTRLTLDTLRARAQGVPFALEEVRGRFLVRGPARLEGILRTHPGLSGLRPLVRLPASVTAEEVPLDGLLPARPFTFTLYFPPGTADRERLLALKQGLVARLTAAAAQRLAAWDNRPPERLAWRLEAHGGEVWLLLDRQRAPGGLPVGSGGRVRVLFSGGPDSLLAAYLLLRRGLEVELVFFDDRVPGRAELVFQAARGVALYLPGRRVRLWRVDHAPLLEALRREAPERERCLLCKEAMVAWAHRRFGREAALASGDLLGEQASQTLPALLSPGRREVLRPVLGLNKEDVFRLLAETPLEPLARLPLPPCPFAPRRPRTRPRRADRRRMLERLLQRVGPPEEVWLQSLDV